MGSSSLLNFFALENDEDGANAKEEGVLNALLIFEAIAPKPMLLCLLLLLAKPKPLVLLLRLLLLNPVLGLALNPLPIIVGPKEGFALIELLSHVVNG